MNEIVVSCVDLSVGFLLGGLFFSGLWWTVKKGLSSKRSVWWFIGSSSLRIGIVLAGFFFMANGSWKKLLACLVGFFLARVVATRLTRTTKGGMHAS